MPLWNPSSSDNDLKFWVRGNGQRTVSGTDIIALYDESGNNTHLNVVGTDANDTDPKLGSLLIIYLLGNSHHTQEVLKVLVCLQTLVLIF